MGIQHRRAGYWDRQAPTYDKRMAGVERRFFPGSRRWVCGRARGATLEIAVGTGANLPHYPADVELVGVDQSEAMLRAARDRAARTGRGVGLCRADMTALPFAARRFDTVVCTFGLCCVPDERAALSEALRVLRPGGALLLADHVAATRWPVRLLQHAANLLTVPLHGEHYTRRPVTALSAFDVDLVAAERLAMGAIEHVHAQKGDDIARA